MVRIGSVGKGKESGDASTIKLSDKGIRIETEPAQNTMNPVEKMWNNKYDARWDKKAIGDVRQRVARSLVATKRTGDARKGTPNLGTLSATFEPAQNTMELFSDKTITVDGKVFQVPKCWVCGKKLSPAYDSIAKKKTGYIWKRNCRHYPKDVRLMVGGGK